jgi:hypothetical protein
MLETQHYGAHLAGRCKSLQQDHSYICGAREIAESDVNKLTRCHTLSHSASKEAITVCATRKIDDDGDPDVESLFQMVHYSGDCTAKHESTVGLQMLAR